MSEDIYSNIYTHVSLLNCSYQWTLHFNCQRVYWNKNGHLHSGMWHEYYTNVIDSVIGGGGLLSWTNFSRCKGDCPEDYSSVDYLKPSRHSKFYDTELTFRILHVKHINLIHFYKMLKFINSLFKSYVLIRYHYRNKCMCFIINLYMLSILCKLYNLIQIWLKSNQDNFLFIYLIVESES